MPWPDAVRGAGVDSHAHVFLRSLRRVEGGRYDPAYDAPVASYLGVLDQAGLSHGVLVQPSFLGEDNAYLVQALRHAPGRLRGVAVIPPGIGADELRALAGAGVVGVRLNLVGRPDPDLGAPLWRAHFRRLAALGWHVEVHAEARRLPTLLPPLLRAGPRVVVDHMGRPDPALGVADPGFRYLLTLGASGRVWVKLSGAYRHGAGGGAIADAAAPLLLRAFGPGCLVWGTDWPHLGFEAPGTTGRTMDALRRWVPDAADREAVMVRTPFALFGFAAGQQAAGREGVLPAQAG